MGMEDNVVLWIWGFCGDSRRFFYGYGMDGYGDCNPIPTAALMP